MFRTLYNAGHRFAETALPKAFWSKTMTEEDKKTNAGFIGVAAGNLLENVALIGMGLAAATAVVLGFATPGGLSVAAFVALGLSGTALAAVGTFGKGMTDGGDKNTGGIVSATRGLRKEVLKTCWNVLRGRKADALPVVPPAEGPGAFKVDAKPAEDFAQAAAGQAAAVAVKPAASSAPSPVNR